MREKKTASEEYFEGVRRASKRLEDVLRLITNQGDDYRPANGRSGGLSDTTQARALAHIEALKRLKAEQKQILAILDEAREVTAGVGKLMGEKYKVILELYYIDRLSFEQAAQEMHVSKSTAINYRNAALDTVEYRGLAGTKAGIGGAT